MGMYGMNSLSEVFGGKVVGLNKPLKFEGGEEVLTRVNEPSNPFKEPKVSFREGGGFSEGLISLKGAGAGMSFPKNGFENTVMSLKGKGFNGVNSPSTSSIESKIFGNFKLNNNRFMNPVNLGSQTRGRVKQLSGFEQALYGSRRVGRGQVFNDFIARNRTVKTPIGPLEVYKTPEEQQAASGWSKTDIKKLQTYRPKGKPSSSVWEPGQGAAEAAQQGSFETYGETYGKPGIIETAEKLGSGASTVGKAIGTGLVTVGKAAGTAAGAALGGLGKGLKALGEGTGIIETPEQTALRLEQEKTLLPLRQQIMQQQMMQQQMMMQPQYPGYPPNPYGMVPSPFPMGSQYGFREPMTYGMPTGLGMMGARTFRTPQQKVIEGFGTGGGGGVSPENILFASQVRGAEREKLLDYSFIPSNEPYANKVVVALGTLGQRAPYTEVVQESLGTMGRKKEGKESKEVVRKAFKYPELPGGPTYPRQQFIPAPQQPQQPQIVYVQQPAPVQQLGYQPQPEYYEPPQPVAKRVVTAGGSKGPGWSPYSKKPVNYVRGPYRRRKVENVQYMPPPQQIQQVPPQFVQGQNAPAVSYY